MKRLLFSLAACVALLACGGVAGQSPTAWEWPRETGVFAPGAGSEIANAYCLNCHSLDYVTMQPPMPRAFWQAEVKKMVDKYGGTLPEGSGDRLIEYLTSQYGMAGTTNTVASTTGKAAGPPVLMDASAAGLARQMGCVSCHLPDRRLVGPAFKEIADKYKVRPDAIEQLSLQISKGGGGQWGSIPMPPFAFLTPMQVKDLAKWVLSAR